MWPAIATALCRTTHSLELVLPARNLQVPGCDEWVQCDRCQLWRLVPQAWAQAVRDDTRQEWLCEYAQVGGGGPRQHMMPALGAGLPPQSAVVYLVQRW